MLDGRPIAPGARRALQPAVPAAALLVTAILVTVLPSVGCAAPSAPTATAPTSLVPSSAHVTALQVEVLATYPHDETMYTQGLEIAHGMLYESSGRIGESRIRAIALTNSTPGPVVAESTLPEPLFGEGITVTPTRLWQLTWKDEVAIERDPVSLAPRRQIRYQGEGWGICHTGNRLVMSDGSDRLTFRDPDTFVPTAVVRVHLDNNPVTGLNELECVGDTVWANVYRTEQIVRINPEQGAVTGIVDAAGLLDPQRPAPDEVLNGIAAIPDSDEFFITGKYWPTLFRVRFVPAS